MITRHQGIKALLSLILLFYAGVANAQEDKQPIQSAVIAEQTVNEAINNVENQIISIHDLLASQEEKTEQKVKGLETLISSQKDTIKSLELKLKMLASKPITNGTTFEVWSGIMLGAAAVILTAVAVLVGIGSFWGLREIKDGASKSAVTTATRVIETLLPLSVAKQTEIELQRLIVNGNLDSVVDEVMQKIVYKDVAFDDDIPSEEAAIDTEKNT